MLPLRELREYKRVFIGNTKSNATDAHAGHNSPLAANRISNGGHRKVEVVPLKKWHSFTVVLAALAVFLTMAGAHYLEQKKLRAAAEGFDGARAFRDLQRLVALGPRPAGSPALAEARRYIADQLSDAGVEISYDSFVATTPTGNIPMTNVIGVVHGDSSTVVILAGHYDTASVAGVRFVGANDGGSSAAFLLEMARFLSRRKSGYTYWLVFFDGEEALKQWSASDSLYGSRHLAEKLSCERKLDQIKALILMDMVADRHLNILCESNSTEWLRNVVFRNARTLGYGSFFNGGTFPVEDDHSPFLARGVPSVDIIDLTPFRTYHHTEQDSIDKCNPKSLTIVGRVVLATLAELERRG
jgi:hypothetical protein